MRFTSKVLYAIGVAAAIALSASAADARSRVPAYDGTYGSTVPSEGRDFVYGANRAPYGWDRDNPRDFQLQGSH